MFNLVESFIVCVFGLLVAVGLTVFGVAIVRWILDYANKQK